MSNQIPDAIQLAFLTHKYPITSLTKGKEKFLERLRNRMVNYKGTLKGFVFMCNEDTKNTPLLYLYPISTYGTFEVEDVLKAHVKISEELPNDTSIWGFVGVLDQSEVSTLDFHGDIDMPKPAVSKPKKLSLSQLQKDALEVHRAKLEIELNAAISNVKEKTKSVDAARHALVTSTNDTLYNQALVEVKKLYQPVLDGLKAVGFNVELKLIDSKKQSGKAYNVVPEKIAYTVTITEVKTEKTRNEHGYSSSAYYDPESGSTKRAGSRLRRVDPFMYPIEQDQRAFAIMQMMSMGPGYSKFNPFFGGMDLDVEVALISKEYVFPVPEDLKAKLAESEVLRKEGDALQKEYLALDRKLDGLANLERVFLAALAEDNLMQSKEGKELLSKIGSIPELPRIG